MLFLYDFQYGSRSPYLALDLLIDKLAQMLGQTRRVIYLGRVAHWVTFKFEAFLLKPDWVFDFGIKPLG